MGLRMTIPVLQQYWPFVYPLQIIIVITDIIIVIILIMFTSFIMHHASK